ncbi:hypothetical protein ACFC8N_37040 [Streptomyces sp. NPDC055966]|uniref:hypothetical protein n=1 Tax=Streptomyces sp. NPDC055966 TaxID=3345669 RepID=UPI0035DEC771
MGDNRGDWESGTTPWARRLPDAEQKALPCYFCGERTAMTSWGDLPDDTGRLEVYCDNELCDAREVVVLVQRDGAGAHDRADVRALRAIDTGSAPKVDALERYHDAKQKVPRRRDTSAFTMEVR